MNPVYEVGPRSSAKWLGCLLTARESWLKAATLFRISFSLPRNGMSETLPWRMSGKARFICLFWIPSLGHKLRSCFRRNGEGQNNYSIKHQNSRNKCNYANMAANFQNVCVWKWGSKITWMLRKVAYHSIISAWDSQQRYLKRSTSDGSNIRNHKAVVCLCDLWQALQVIILQLFDSSSKQFNRFNTSCSQYSIFVSFYNNQSS